MIVLWTLAILHARLGGFIREWGLHLSAVFTGAVITFSWWHVNFLNTGLHSYGFTTAKGTLWIFYSAVLAILVFGFVARAFDRAATPERPKSDKREPRVEGTPALDSPA